MDAELATELDTLSQMLIGVGEQVIALSNEVKAQTETLRKICFVLGVKMDDAA